MWLLGAGASASAGIPTATDMIWEFKQQLFVSQRRVSANSVADLSSSYVRDKLQNHIDSLGNLPPAGDLDEYAALFEAVFPSEADRRTYIDGKRAGGKPSYGHIGLASLMKAGLVHIVWTTNFDPMIADGCAQVFGNTGSLTSVGLETAEIAQHCINESRWPIEIKFHGDFRSRRLKNTQDELREQDAKMRQLLIQTSIGRGLIVCGYSGRDESVMSTLDAAIAQDNAFANGVFWLYRNNEPPPVRVQQLIRQAERNGIDAALVPIVNFDEIIRDLTRVSNKIDHSALDAYGTKRTRCSDAAVPIGQVGFPVIRLNAIPVVKAPTACRKVVCTIDGYRAVRDAIAKAGVSIIFGRVKAGVLLFGDDDDIRKALEPYRITEFDLHSIEKRRLGYESSERGLLREALSRAIARNRQLQLIHQRGTDLLYPDDPTAEVWKPLRAVAGEISGQVPNSSLTWREGVGLRLDFANEGLWLLIEPRIIFDGIDDSNKAVAASFSRERGVKRYNRELNTLIDFWTKLIVGDQEPLAALGISNGVDALFELGVINAFSRRVGV